MIHLNNIINTIMESDTVFVILVIILVGISVSMFYLIYAQNKELKALNKNISKPSNDFKKVEESEELPEEGPTLVALTDDKIPDELEYTQALWQKDDFDLLKLSQELETLPKERKVNLTPYEEEQEEKAIISYDELVNKKNKEDVTNNIDNNFALPKLAKNESVQNGNVNDTYKHEEDFLKSLKDLRRMIN